jgi:NAD(P)-dependent dehydrogenase (short-subunit alcohol dehydrogenase family)
MVKSAALIIGAGDATGGAIARAFARDGFVACVNRRPRNAEQLEALAVAIRAEGHSAHAFPADARDEAAMAELVEAVERDIGPIEVAVFNVGANVRFTVTDTSAQVYRKVWEMACFAGFLMGREVAKHMIARAGYDHFHRSDRLTAWRRWLFRLLRCESRAANAGPEHGAGAWSAGDSRCPCRD